jgi:hypothetical protein
MTLETRQALVWVLERHLRLLADAPVLADLGPSERLLALVYDIAAPRVRELAGRLEHAIEERRAAQERASRVVGR